MTISTESTRVEYTGNGSTLPFAVPFRFLDKTDLVVVLRTILTGVEAVQTIYTHYTVLGAGDTSGTVTFVTAPPATQKVVIYNDPPLTQLVDYISGGTFPAETHEEALDRLTIQQKRTREIATRTPRLGDSDTDGSGAYDAKSNRISSLGTPTATTDATTKTYVDVLVNNTALGPAPTGLIATGSVTSRLLADRWGEVTNVMDFGAVGDGATDDTAAINAAITACPNGETLHFPDRTFKTTATINLRSKAVDAAGATITGYHTDIIVLLGGVSTSSNAPPQNIFTVSRNGGATSTPDIRVLGAKGQHVTVDWCNFIQFYADTDDATAGSIGYSTFHLKYANRVELNTNPSPAGSATQWINENTFYINRADHILIDGTYPHNHNYFIGCTLEGTYNPPGVTTPLIDLQVGVSNYFLRVRGEGVLGVVFARGTSDCIVERGYVAGSHRYASGLNAAVQNDGDMCGVRHVFDKYAPDKLLVGFDYQTLTLAGGRYNVPGVSNVAINTDNLTAVGFALVYESPKLAVSAGGATFDYALTGWVAGTFTAAEVDFANNQIDYGTARHGYPDNYGPVRLTTTGALPSGLTATTTDYWLNVVDKHKIQFLDAHGGSVVALADAGSGTSTLNNPGVRALLKGYTSTGAEIDRTSTLTSFTAAQTTHASDQVDFGTAHGFLDSDGPIRLTTGGALPAGLSTGTDYWVNVVSANVIQFLDAFDGSVVNLTSDGTGTQTIEIRDVLWDFASVQKFGTQDAGVNYSNGREFYLLNSSARYARLQVHAGGVGAAFSGFYLSSRGIDPATERDMLASTFPAHAEKFSGTITFAASDDTPSVATGRTFITAGSTAITDFDDGVDGQLITVRAHGAITLTDSANLQLQGDGNFVMAADDIITLANIGGTNWYETGRRTVA
jgi:hypothetical protein